MLVELKALKSNPYRDFTIDPIDDENVDALTASIKQDGFWGGIVCRRVNGHLEIGAGHHRVRAAIKAGVKTADVFVGELDDSAMIRVYARENATQRGNSSSAIAGTVASAVRFVAKAILTGNEVSQIWDTSQERIQASAALTSEHGIGQRVIVAFLEGVPGINKSTVEHQLANLKASGHYARIIRDVKDEVEQEHCEALKALERAERERQRAEEAERKAEEERKAAVARAKAAREVADKKRAEEARQRAEAEAKLAEKRSREAEQEMKKFDALREMRDTANKAADQAAQREVTFNFEGVAKHFKNENQVRIFREVVTGEGMRPYLPVYKQPSLAAELVRLAKSRGVELSGAFIRENAMTLLLAAKLAKRAFSKEDERKAREQDVIARHKMYQDEFARNVRGMMSAGVKLKEIMDKYRSVTFFIKGEFRSAVKSAKQVIETLDKRI